MYFGAVLIFIFNAYFVPNEIKMDISKSLSYLNPELVSRIQEESILKEIPKSTVILTGGAIYKGHSHCIEGLDKGIYAL